MTYSIVKYTDEYKHDLETLLYAMSKEIFGYGTASIDDFVAYHWAIYLALKDDEVIGLSSFMYNTYHGLRPPTIGNTYMYVKPEHRRGRATYLLSMQSGVLSVENNLPLEHYYASNESRLMGSKMDGQFLYDAVVYSPEEIAKKFTKMKSHIKIKE